jgi:hypothetical protein
MACESSPDIQDVNSKITCIYKYELDSDVHMEIWAPDDAFVTLEVPPEFPLQTLPSKGQMITAWGIVCKRRAAPVVGATSAG